MKHFDYIILGGGCSGLSLALELSKRERDKTILVLEKRYEYLSDRTWCFWNIGPHPFENEVQFRWKNWQVQHKGVTRTSISNRYEYQCIPSENFYKGVTLQLEKNSQVTLLMGVEVELVTEIPSKVLVTTSKGAFSSFKAFDSRPIGQKVPLYQHFLGWEVEVEREAFDPSKVILMDFDVPQGKGLNFIYLLPFSTKRALIESTFISPELLSNDEYEKVIKDYLVQRYSLSSYQLIRTESGALPLFGSPKNRGTPRITPIGIRGGWMRASTGYAFLSIQERVKEVFNQKRRVRDRVENYLDRIFLSFLRMYPEKSPELFFNLIKNNNPDRLVRFLMGNWTYRDLIKVILSMPKIAMIRQALK